MRALKALNKFFSLMRDMCFLDTVKTKYHQLVLYDDQGSFHNSLMVAKHAVGFSTAQADIVRLKWAKLV